MTIQQLVGAFESIARAHPNINSFKVGDLIPYQEAKEYPMMVVRNEEATFGEGIVTHSFYVAVLDLLNSDRSDVLQVQSDTFLIIEDIVTLIEQSETFADVLELQLGTVTSPIDLANSDVAAGQQMTISITVARNGCVNLNC